MVPRGFSPLRPPEYLLYFTPNWTPHLIRLRNPAFIVRGDLKKPLAPAFKFALRPVFEQLQVKWAPPPAPWRVYVITIVFLLLLFGSLLYLALTEAPT